MKSTSTLLLTACVLSLSVAEVANAGVTVTFTHPEKYADMPFAQRDKQEVMDALKLHFDKLGAALPAGQDLKVDVLDIDLAGRIEPASRTSQDLRILRGGADWPVIALRYSLESQGKMFKSGEDRLSDTTYLFGHNQYASGENLRYEKRMLDRWFKKTLVAGKAGG